jgi:hypothetical protein
VLDTGTDCKSLLIILRVAASITIGTVSTEDCSPVDDGGGTVCKMGD